MPIPNIEPNSMTLEEMNELIQLLQDAYFAKLEEQQNDIAIKKQLINESRASLTSLIGTPDQAPYDPGNPNIPPSIRSVNKHSEQVLAENAGLVLKLILSGLETLAVNQKMMIEILD